MKNERTQLTAPWADSVSCIGPMDDSEEFVRERSRVHSQYIVEENKTKRLALGTSVVLAVAGCLTVVFAPVGAGALATFVGVSLGLGAAGAAGFKRLGIQSPKGKLIADSCTTPTQKKPTSSGHPLKGRN